MSAAADRNAAILAHIRANPGQSGSEIGRRFGVSRNVVMGLAHRNGIQVGGGPRRKKEAGLPHPTAPTRRQTPTPRGCRWIDGNPGRRYDEAWSYCGAAVVGNGPWCAAHRERVYRPAAVS